VDLACLDISDMAAEVAEEVPQTAEQLVAQEQMAVALVEELDAQLRLVLLTLVPAVGQVIHLAMVTFLVPAAQVSASLSTGAPYNAKLKSLQPSN
jgi:hypothetical protein